MGTPRQYTPDEDGPLLVSLQQGDRATFEALTRKYIKRMFNLAFLLSGDAACAAEASRNAFVAAWREVKSLRSTMHFSTWLVVLILREYRHLLDFEAEGDACVAPVADGADLSGGVNDTPLQRDLRRYVRSLALEQATVLVLHYVRGYSLEKIAVILQLREDVLRSRLFTAQEQLSTLLRQVTDVSGRAGDEEHPPHPEIRCGFSAYLDNSAAEEDKDLIRRHLGGCGSCREALAQLEWIAEHLKKLPDIEPPAWLVATIMESARTEPSPPPPPRLPYNPFSRGSMSIVALIFAAVALYWYLTPHEAEDSPEQTAPSAPTGVGAPSPVATRRGGDAGPSAPHPVFPASGGGGSGDRGTNLRLDAPTALVPSVPIPALTVPTVPSPPLSSQRQAPPAGPKQPPPPARSRAESSPTLPADWGDNPSVVRSTPRKAAAPKVPGSETAVLLNVRDPDTAQEAIERVVTSLGGTITGRGYSGGRTILYTRVDLDNVMELMGGVGKIGTILELPHIPEGATGPIDLTIRW
jgi:RNA polymerase sigma-70 factor (ECF subfamily)